MCEHQVTITKRVGIIEDCLHVASLNAYGLMVEHRSGALQVTITKRVEVIEDCLHVASLSAYGLMVEHHSGAYT